MWSRVLACLWLFGAVTHVSACGKSDGSGPVPEGELPGRLATLSCDRLANCCNNANRPIDASACQRSLTAELELLFDRSSWRVVYDASAAGECLDQLGVSTRCSGFSRPDEAPACQRLWRGTVPVGKACDTSDECAPATFQIVRCDNQVCTPHPRTPRGEVGEACAFTCPAGSSCDSGELPLGPDGIPTLAVCFVEDGVYCDSGVCAKLVPLGGECSDRWACQGAAFCDFTASGVCRALKAEGATCSGNTECESGNCEGGSLGSLPTTSSRCLAPDVASAEQCSARF